MTPAAYAAWRGAPLGRVVEALELDLVFEMAGDLQGAAVLDVGCGDGSYALEAAARGATATGIDRAPEMIAAARARGAGSGARFVEGDALALPFADGSFDVVIAVTLLCFVADAEGAVREMARVLRPGGRLVLGDLGRLSTWALKRRVKGWLGSETWRGARFWTCAELRALLRSAGLLPGRCAGSVYLPPFQACARPMARLDRALRGLGVAGAAFIAVRGDRPAATPAAPP